MDTPFVTGWHRLLQEIELARHYHLVPAGRVGPRHALSERILPSLLYMKAVSLLDDGIRGYMNSECLGLAGQPASLGGRIRALDEEGRWGDADDVVRIKDRRNELAHEAEEFATWDELDAAVLVLHRELQHLGLVDEKPDYKFFAQRSAARAGTTPGVHLEWEHTYGDAARWQPRHGSQLHSADYG